MPELAAAAIEANVIGFFKLPVVKLLGLLVLLVKGLLVAVFSLKRELKPLDLLFGLLFFLLLLLLLQLLLLASSPFVSSGLRGSSGPVDDDMDDTLSNKEHDDDDEEDEISELDEEICICFSISWSCLLSID